MNNKRPGAGLRIFFIVLILMGLCYNAVDSTRVGLFTPSHFNKARKEALEDRDFDHELRLYKDWYELSKYDTELYVTIDYLHQARKEYYRDNDPLECYKKLIIVKESLLNSEEREEFDRLYELSKPYYDQYKAELEERVSREIAAETAERQAKAATAPKSSSSTKKKSSHSYGVDGYDDFDIFYDDHYDDFIDIDEAEDYFYGW